MSKYAQAIVIENDMKVFVLIIAMLALSCTVTWDVPTHKTAKPTQVAPSRPFPDARCKNSFGVVTQCPWER